MCSTCARHQPHLGAGRADFFGLGKCVQRKRSGVVLFLVPWFRSTRRQDSSRIQRRKRQAAAAFAAVLFEEESEEEENDLEDEFVVVAASVAVFRRKRVCAEDYFRTTVPRLVVKDFRSHFRLSCGTVELIVQQLGTLPGFVQAGDCPGRERVPVEKQLLVAIWLLGNQETFRSVCDRFDLPRSSTHVIFKKIHRHPIFVQRFLCTYVKRKNELPAHVPSTFVGDERTRKPVLV